MKFAHIQHLESGVAFSDPWYKEDVWCQYRKAFSDTNWFMKLESQLDEGKYGSLHIHMFLGRPTVANSVRLERSEEGITVFAPMRYRLDQVELGIDSASMFCGSLKDLQQFGESAAFRTGGDGMFGDLFVFTLEGDDQPAGFALVCAFDPSFMTEQDFFNHVVSSFGGKELSEKQYLNGISPKNLGNRVLLANEIEQFAKQQGQNAKEKGSNTPER